MYTIIASVENRTKDEQGRVLGIREKTLSSKNFTEGKFCVVHFSLFPLYAMCYVW